jgi:acetyltransferase-like isoleucine patch superfamily enzyme
MIGADCKRNSIRTAPTTNEHTYLRYPQNLILTLVRKREKSRILNGINTAQKRLIYHGIYSAIDGLIKNANWGRIKNKISNTGLRIGLSTMIFTKPRNNITGIRIGLNTLNMKFQINNCSLYDAVGRVEVSRGWEKKLIMLPKAPRRLSEL